MSAPQSLPESTPDSDDLYQLADDSPATPRRTSPGATVPAKVGEGAVSRVVPARVLPVSYREEKTIAGAETPMQRYFPDRIRDLYLPLVLLVGGMLVDIIVTWIFSDPMPFSLPVMMRKLCVGLMVSTALMLAAVLVAGKLRQIDFGPLPVAILKLSAASIGTEGITYSLGMAVLLIPFLGPLLFFFVPIICFYTLLGALFDLDSSDATFTTVIVIIVSVTYSLTIKPMLM